MLVVQVRRRTQVLWFYATTLRSSRASLRDFHAHASAAYATCGFERALAPREWEQLALHASFPPAAAAALARCLREATADGEEASGAGLATAAAAADNDDGSQHGGPAAERPADRAAPRRRPLQQQLQLQRLSQVTVPAWRMKYFLFWFNSHLETLQLLRAEWEQQSPQLVCGFDLTRVSATAMLFRRPKGTCMVRLGMEVGGVIVSLRPDKHTLPDQRRTTESYYSSISVEQLAGQVYEMAEQPWRPEQRKRREGAVVHVYVPNSSLRMLGGLLGCLRRMRHTKLFLDASAGEVLSTGRAFRLLHPPPRPTTAQLHALGQEVVQRLQHRKQQAGQLSEEAQRELEAWLRDALEPQPQRQRRRRRRDVDQQQQELQWLLRSVSFPEAARPHPAARAASSPAACATTAAPAAAADAAAAVVDDDQQELQWLLHCIGSDQAPPPPLHVASDGPPSGTVMMGVVMGFQATALIGAVVTGVLARRRRTEMQKLNEKLRQINGELRRQREAQESILSAVGLGAAEAGLEPGGQLAPPPAGDASATGGGGGEGEGDDGGEGGAGSGIQAAAALEALRRQAELLQRERSALEAALSSPSAAHPVELFGEAGLSVAGARRTIHKCIRGAKELVRDGRPAECFELLEQGLKLAAETADVRAERALTRVRARALRESGNLSAALLDLQRTLALSEQLGEAGDSDTYGDMGDVLTELGDLESAARYYDLCIDAIRDEAQQPLSSTWDV
ncbi:FLUORESCENT IN BLUE chloroplastic-like isoform X3 [Micractinium conductrix]|uniref:FLUORESCENT IN BLUE chloroplastic-like isoform X3 n=1 Tax=Micractinium conductrix TaxID=554055 RepID=A0A2P6V4E2_9CHLO|nr:FLUORESCENT IN BLUE chloroplastic-like isoform X3 [Micractinium conductrix]|eukprot:PSC68955.1 FLUORESCENT IN BLUE chloroplastic-like isoform X3 [Micractinium conductrix]